MKWLSTSGAALACASLTLGTGCEGAKHFTTDVEVVQVERFGESPANAHLMALELRYAECPADGRRVLQADEKFARCAAGLKSGDRVKAEIVSTYVAEKAQYRSEIVKIGECPLKVDPKEEANYELVQTCTELKSTGHVVGVHCDRQRGSDLVAKCPWLRRK